MIVDQEECIGCGQCEPWCPVRAISVEETAQINLDECAECGSCLRNADCPTDALQQQELTWPRTVRSILSDPLTVAEESGISGRGTEEMKTNEVTGRFRPGEVGIGIEVGRAVTGARFYDVEKIAKTVSKFGVEYEKANPVTSLMADPKTGQFKEDVLNEKVLSAILEFAIPEEKLPELLEALKEPAGQVDCVFTVCVACKTSADESVPAYKYLDQAGVWYAPNGKTNIGLGRPLAEVK